MDYVFLVFIEDGLGHEILLFSKYEEACKVFKEYTEDFIRNKSVKVIINSDDYLEAVDEPNNTYLNAYISKKLIK